MAGLGAVPAVSIRTTETFHAVTGFLSLPLLFLSGAMFPFTGLPSWLAAATTLNPVSYAVDAVRRTLTTALPGSPAFAGPTWAGWRPSALLETTVLAVVVGGVAAPCSARASGDLAGSCPISRWPETSSRHISQ